MTNSTTTTFQSLRKGLVLTDQKDMLTQMRTAVVSIPEKRVSPYGLRNVQNSRLLNTVFQSLRKGLVLTDIGLSDL